MLLNMSGRSMVDTVFGFLVSMQVPFKPPTVEGVIGGISIHSVPGYGFVSPPLAVPSSVFIIPRTGDVGRRCHGAIDRNIGRYPHGRLFMTGATVSRS